MELPRPPKDDHGKELYQRYNLGETPSLLQIEPVAKQLLDDVTTRIEASELVLGRHVGSEEIEQEGLLGIANYPFSLESGYRFIALAQQRFREDNKDKQA